ncbi:hypothetical protein JJB07_14695 [Tumebacillus sp. ITR2]|uniref:Uncharacterized protein n=1 Tax=Tumebacillus amylolyticus TaxID=2801339 RepID=A0ABS1JC89_9BACL|nr:hypothetical protein [Tumebacillus amylolyticus]MBL0387887.1 hypothetical protein [Tumebacillus amylolyticus]
MIAYRKTYSWSWGTDYDIVLLASNGEYHLVVVNTGTETKLHLGRMLGLDHRWIREKHSFFSIEDAWQLRLSLADVPCCKVIRQSARQVLMKFDIDQRFEQLKTIEKEKARVERR